MSQVRWPIHRDSTNAVDTLHDTALVCQAGNEPLHHPESRASSRPTTTNNTPNTSRHRPNHAMPPPPHGVRHPYHPSGLAEIDEDYELVSSPGAHKRRRVEGPGTPFSAPFSPPPLPAPSPPPAAAAAAAAAAATAATATATATAAADAHAFVLRPACAASDTPRAAMHYPALPSSFARHRASWPLRPGCHKYHTRCPPAIGR